MSLPPLRIEPKPSRYLRMLLIVIAALALLSLWLSDLPRTFLLTVPLLLAAAWRGTHPTLRDTLVLRTDGTVIAQDGHGDERDIDIVSLQRRGPLLVLGVADGVRRVRLSLLPDIVGAADRRRLMLWFERRRHTQRAAIRARSHEQGVSAHV